MRRKDREVLDPALIKEIIEKCDCCRLGFYDEGEIYILPLSFGYSEQGDEKIFYFHGAKLGRKVDLVSKSPQVGFELDTYYKLQEDENPCEYSARFQSIIGTGQVMPIENKEEKIIALKSIMVHTSQKDHWEFTEAMINSVFVFKLLVKEMSCKYHT